MIEHCLDPHAHDPATRSTPEDRAIDRALDCWADWSRDVGGVAPAWFAGVSPGIRYRTSATFDEMCRDADATLGEIVDACVDSLPADQRMALHVSTFHVAWSGPAMVYAAALEAGRRGLLALLLRRGAIVVV